MSQFVSNWIKNHPNYWMYPKDGNSKITLWNIIRSFTGVFRTLPDFIIIGVQKGGTTSLYNYLIEHPDIFPALHKEIHFFDRNFHRGINWYRANFAFLLVKYFRKIQNKIFITGEATPDYLLHEATPKKIKDTLPSTKFLVVLRNPIDRAYSHYNMRVNTGDEKLPFEEAIEKESKRIKNGGIDFVHFSYLHRGHYADHLEKWFNLFPKKQFLIVETSQLEKNFQPTYDQICNFLGVPIFKLDFKKHHVGKYSNQLSPHTRKELSEYFKPHNEKLYKLLGTTFDWD
jgi:hypothetical protein